MEVLAAAFVRYVAGKVRAGADVIQVFDSWVGALSPADYEEFVAPYSARILAAVDVPTIHFGTGTATLLPAMAEAGGDVIGLDWRIPLDRGWEEVGHGLGVQGNLDPAVLLGPWERVEAAAAMSSAAPAAAPATSSTSATGCSRTRTRTSWAASSSSCTGRRSRRASDRAPARRAGADLRDRRRRLGHAGAAAHAAGRDARDLARVGGLRLGRVEGRRPAGGRTSALAGRAGRAAPRSSGGERRSPTRRVSTTGSSEACAHPGFAPRSSVRTGRWRSGSRTSRPRPRGRPRAWPPSRAGSDAPRPRSRPTCRRTPGSRAAGYARTSPSTMRPTPTSSPCSSGSTGSRTRSATTPPPGERPRRRRLALATPAGLSQAGWVGGLDAVRWAYLRATALRLSWLAVMLPDEPEPSVQEA